MHAVLIVDDEALVREAIGRLTDWSKFGVSRIVEASDAFQALEFLKNDPALDLVLTDMKMPAMDGVQFLKEIERLGLKKAVIAISGYSQYEYTRQAVQSGLVDYILKPVVAQELNAALAAAVARLEKDSSFGESVQTKHENQLINEVLVFLDLHFLERVSLQELADHFSISREHLSRLFKKHIGMNLFEYITHKKVEEAKFRLLNSGQPVKTIAYELGFDDEHYFSKVFRRIAFQSPTEFRTASR